MAELHGGPDDGAHRRWTDAMVETADGIYRRARDGSYEFEGHASWRCYGCGGFVTPLDGIEVKVCPLCGHVRERAA